MNKKRGSLASTLIVALLFVLAAFAAMLVYNRQTMARSRENVYSDLRADAISRVEGVKMQLEDKLQLLGAFSACLSEGESQDMVELMKTMRAIEENAGFSSVGFIGTDGLSLDSNGKGFNLSQRDYFLKAMKGENAVAYLEESIMSGGKCILLAVPYMPDETVDGVVFGAYEEADFVQLLSVGAYGLSGYAMMCMDDGTIIANGVDDGVLASGSLTEALGEAEFEDGASLEGILADIGDGSGGVAAFSVSGERCYAVYMPMEINGWELFSVLDADAVDSDMVSVRRSGYILISSVMLICLLSAAYLVVNERRHAKKLEQDAERLKLGEEQYRIAVQQSSKFVFRYDIQTKTAYFSEEGARELGLGETVVYNVPESILDGGFVEEVSRGDFQSFHDAMKKGEKNGSADFRMKSGNGRWLWYRADFTTIFDEDGLPVRAVISFLDITSEHEKELIYQRYRQSFMATPRENVALFEYNLTRDAGEYSEGDLLGMFRLNAPEGFNETTLFALNTVVYREDGAAFAELFNRERLLAMFYEGKRELKLEFRRRTEDGGTQWLSASIEMVQYPGTEEVKAFITYRNIDKEKRARLELEKRSQTDALTGLLNRETFAMKMGKMIKSGVPGSQHAMIIFDMDGFKNVNDTLGHIQGDELLLNVARDIRTLMRSEDLVGRLGGDEFIICLKNVPYVDIVERRAQMILNLIERKVGEGLAVSASLGIAMYPMDGKSFSELYASADSALYRAKESGRNRCVFFRTGMRGQRKGGRENGAPPAELAGGRSGERLARELEEKERYSFIMERSGAVVFERDLRSERFFASEGFERFSFGEREIYALFRGELSAEGIHRDDWEIFQRDIAAPLREGHDRAQTILRLRARDGGYEPHGLLVVCTRDEGGSIVRVLGVITEAS